jgi:asparagine synthase (glutamine-hydrolysing)
VGAPRRDLQGVIDRMTDALTHRGPDDRGTVVFGEAGTALGMRRLSILDLAGGHQPMKDEAGRHHLVFNGEIYNFAALREELVRRGHRFVTDHSDTEVLVHGFEEWGVDLFPRLNGMFAVAIWDAEKRQLTLARDRMGKKPLYVARISTGWAFGSELKALFAHPQVGREVDLVALEQYLAFDYVIGPRTMLRDVSKLPGGHVAVVDTERYEVSRFWEPTFRRAGRVADERGFLEEFDTLLDAAVARRMVADVPVGLFLSGGLDSTTVGYFMRRHSDDVHSFSIGFEEKEFDESAHAQTAARSLGTRHHLEVFSQDRLQDIIFQIPDVLDEPMGDQSVLPTYLLSTFTRKGVKVALGGDGSDELLMGYNAFRPLKMAWMMDRLPLILRRGMARAARSAPATVGSRRLRGTSTSNPFSVSFATWGPTKEAPAG